MRIAQVRIRKRRDDGLVVRDSMQTSPRPVGEGPGVRAESSPRSSGEGRMGGCEKPCRHRHRSIMVTTRWRGPARFWRSCWSSALGFTWRNRRWICICGCWIYAFRNPVTAPWSGNRRRVQTFLDVKFPKIQRLAARLGADLAFEDEAGSASTKEKNWDSRKAGMKAGGR